jgi:hypothetical protein
MKSADLHASNSVKGCLPVKRLFLIGVAAVFLATGTAHARNRDNPYTEGVRDYYSGLCYRARPYLDGPPEKAVLWERGG